MTVSQTSNSLASKVRTAIMNPRLAADFILAKVASRLLPKKFIADSGNRSDSDNGSYVRFVESANRSYEKFKRFKRHPHYRAILEHVSREDGQVYLDIVGRDSPELLSRIDDFKINDRIGDPIRYSYPGAGQISPSTLRYIKVTSDLKRLFQGIDGGKIAEIGIGYGGQLLVLDQVIATRTYFLFDLPPVLELASRYLESHVLRTSYKTFTLNQFEGNDEFDLVISNYAFSELPSHVQMRYVEKVINKSKRGYLTMNSGIGDPPGKARLTIDQLRSLLPPFEILEEKPLTAPNNYIIVWGHR
jgi:putative sugar O-methyltransferase